MKRQYWGNRMDKSVPSRRGGGVSRFRRIPPGREARSLYSPLKQLSDQLDNEMDGLAKSVCALQTLIWIGLIENGGIGICVELSGTLEKMIQKRSY
ncbi:hypothetical protein B0H99_10520 [Planomicrobium soli]|uniref:Uncharacterized protein n=1 Tax=Planomicrobium soli TaxID=1176648 RepID=A0A2P8H203_9BACL|nr:hypothetical protein B0H99_10520 [Planomicrobium soli]